MKRFIVFVVNLTKFIVNKYYRYVFKMLLNTTFTNLYFFVEYARKENGSNCRRAIENT